MVFSTSVKNIFLHFTKWYGSGAAVKAIGVESNLAIYKELFF